MAKLGDRWPYARCGHTATVLGGAPSTPRATLAVEGMLVLGGLGTRPDYDEYSSHFLSDAFLLDVTGRKWQKLQPSGFMPRGRSLHAAVALETPSVRGGVRVAMFGGWCKGNGEVTRSFTIAEHKMLYLNDVHILTIERPSAADTPPECSWASLKPRGPSPAPRVSCACVATPRGLLLLGGTAHAGRTLGVAELQLDNGEAEWEEEEEEESVVDAEAVVGGQAAERCKWVWLDESGSRPTALGRLSATRVDGLVYLLFPSPPADDQPQPACVLVMDTGASRPSLRRELYLQRTREATLDKHAHASEAACRSAFGTSSSGQRVPYKFFALGDLHDATERELERLRREAAASPVEDDGIPPKRLLPSASFLSTSPRIEQLPKDQMEFPAPGAYGELSLERHSSASFESESDTAFHLSLLAPRQRSGATAARPIAQIRKCEGFRAYLAASGANHAPPTSSYAAATSSRNAYTSQLTEAQGAHELLLSPRDGVGRATLLHAHPAFQLPPDSPGPAAYSPQPPPLLAVAAHASFRSSSARIGYLPHAPPPLPPPPPPPPRRRPGKREHAAATRVAAAARGRAARLRLQQLRREAAATRVAAAARRRAARGARSRRAAAASKMGAAARGRAVRRRLRREAAAAARLQARQRGKSARARAARRREERRREGEFPLRIRVDQLPVAISIRLPPAPPPPKEPPPHCPTPPPALHEGRPPRSHATTPRARMAEAPSLAWRWQPVGFASTEKRSWQRPTRTCDGPPVAFYVSPRHEAEAEEERARNRTLMLAHRSHMLKPDLERLPQIGGFTHRSESPTFGHSFPSPGAPWFATYRSQHARADGARPAPRRFLADGGYGPILKPRPTKAKGGSGAVKEGDPAGAAAPPTSEGEWSLELLEQQLSTKLSTGSDDLLKWGLKTGRAECVAPTVNIPDPYPSRSTAKASRSGDPSFPAELPGWKRSRPNSHGMPMGSNATPLKAVHSHRPRTVIAPPQAHGRIDR